MKKLILVLVSLVLASCTSNNNTNENNSKDQVKDNSKDTFNVGIYSDITTLDPSGHNEMLSSYATHSIYDTLFMANEIGEPEPFLAESHEYVTDTELIIKIFEGVKFHNGEEMTSEDVKASLDRAREMKDVSSLYTSIESIDIIDDYTISIKTDTPFAPLIGNLSHSGAGIMPKSLTETEDFNNPIGSGPYKFVSWTSGDSIVFIRNDEYYFEDLKPEWENLVLKIIPEDASRTIALETGEVDFITLLETISYDRVNNTDGIQVIESPSNNINYFFVNIDKEPFNDINFRKALNYALNVEDINIVATDGTATILKSIVPSNILGYNEDVTYTYDLEKAKEYLEMSSYTPDMEFVISTSGDERKRASEVIQNNLSEIGITTTIDVMDQPKYIEITSNGDYEMAMLGWTTATEPDRFLSQLLHSKSINGQNRARYSNPEVDAIIDKGISIIDIEEREKLYEEVYRMVMNDAPWVPLYSKNNLMAGSSDYTYENVITSEGSIYFNFIKSK